MPLTVPELTQLRSDLGDAIGRSLSIVEVSADPASSKRATPWGWTAQAPKVRRPLLITRCPLWRSRDRWLRRVIDGPGYLPDRRTEPSCGSLSLAPATSA